MEDLKTYYRGSLKSRIESLEAVRESLARRDPEAVESVRRTAHSLKGTGASYGFPEVTRAAKAVLEAPDTEVSETAAAMIETMRQVAFGNAEEVASILIVEDDAEMLRLLEAKLGGPDRRVFTAETSARATEILEQEDIALVLLDLVLPDEDGRNLLARLRSVPKYAGIPIIVVSARLGSQIKAECYSLGSDECFEKPVDLSALSAAVASKLLRAGEISREAQKDPLTGLLNRAGLKAAYERARALAERADYPLCLAVLDLDRFKAVNDQLGHHRGDEVLRRVAGVFSRALRRTDRVGRWGGDEFIILLPNADLKGAARALEKLIDSLSRESLLGSDVLEVSPPTPELHLGFSAGVTLVTPELELEAVVAEADQLLYLAKAGGGGRVMIPGQSTETAPRRVLVVDDDDEIAHMLNEHLGRAGFEIRRSADGLAGLKRAVETRFDLLVLDVLMPSMNGFELLGRLRKLPAHHRTPVIMLTSLGSEEDILRAFELGADDYVVKPFSPAELIARAHRLLKR